MSKQFDPRKILKHVANPLLREFFTRREVMGDVPWDEMTETQIEPVYQAWQQMPEHERMEVQLTLQDIHELAGERGQNVLVEEVSRHRPDLLDEITAWEGQHDRAMWVYLNVPEAFEEAAVFAQADALAAGRYWVKRNSLPRTALAVDEKICSALGAAMTAFYWLTQMRGRYCSVEHYRRANGTEYFFGYLDDYPDNHIVFDESGQMQKRAGRYAFENVFAYCPTDGTLEVFARGGKKVIGALQVLFCKVVLGLDIDPEGDHKPAYRLEHLRSGDVPLPTDPADRIAEVEIRSIGFEVVGSPGERIDLRAGRRGNHIGVGGMAAHYLDGDNLPLSSRRVVHVQFRIRFMHDGKGRPRSVTFGVGLSSSDLKSKPDDIRAICERCLKLWGVTDDASN